MPNRRPRVLPWLIVGLFALAIVLDRTGIRYAPRETLGPGTDVSLTAGLFLAAPVVGVIYLFVAFARWHRGFHRRMKAPRQSRRTF